MRVIRLKEVRIDRLRLPGDFPALVEAEKGRDRVRSIGEHGLIRPALVRNGSYEVILGLEDIAALAAIGREHVRCEIAECTDKEVKILRLEAKLQQPHMSLDERNALRGELLILWEGQEKLHVIEEKIRDPEADFRALGKRAAGARAKDRLAEKMGISVAAIRKAQERARRRLKAREEVEAPIPVKRFGMELTEAFEDRLVAARKGMQRLGGHLTTCQRILTEMRKAKLDMPSKQTERVEAMLDELGDYVRHWTPSGLCPYCKGIPKLCPACLSCGGSAMLFKIQEDGILPELTDPKNVQVYIQGEGLKPVGLYAEQAEEGVDVRLVEEGEGNGSAQPRDIPERDDGVPNRVLDDGASAETIEQPEMETATEAETGPYAPDTGENHADEGTRGSGERGMGSSSGEGALHQDGEASSVDPWGLGE